MHGYGKAAKYLVLWCRIRGVCAPSSFMLDTMPQGLLLFLCSRQQQSGFVGLAAEAQKWAQNNKPACKLAHEHATTDPCEPTHNAFDN